jgi:DNA-binding response OmpR family regulator
MGFECATEVVPDLVISDIMMPEMDGMELCRALKQDLRTSHIPVILLTARAGTDSKIEGLDIGADDYVTKPFETKELNARIRNLIEQRRLLRKKFSAGVVLKPGEVAIESLDDAFLQKAILVVEKRMNDEKFSVEELAVEIGMSRVQLHRKLTALTGQSSSEFIRSLRLHRGMELLKKNAGTVSEIAYMVGFGKPSNFAKWFQEQFGVLPSSIRKDMIGENESRHT